MTLQIKQLYSETGGNRPSKEQVAAGQLWINSGDSCIGTKKNDGTIVTYAQLTEAERETARSALTKAVADTTYLGKNAKAASATLADKATILAASRNITLSGDVTGSASFNGSANAAITATLANSGVTAGAYGPTAAATLAFGGSVNIPQVTVDGKGRVTKAVHYAITLPAAPTSVSGNASTATKLQTARTIALSGAVTGTATSFDGSKNVTIPTTAVDGTKVSVFGAASSDAAGTVGAVPAPAAGYQTRFLRGDGTWQTPTNNKVQQTVSTTNGEYPLLAKSVTATTSVNGQTIFGANVTMNPSTGTLTAATFSGSLSGNATTATTLETARTIRTNLASTSTASFNGSANVTPGVTGVLAVANGGTGNTTGLAASATKLATARTIQTDLASTSAASFDGSGNVTPGIKGTLGTANGGTGRTDGKALNVTQVVTLSAVGPLGYTSQNGQYLTTSAAIAYWNGRYSGSSSNLQYCKTGTIIGSNGGTVTGNLTVNGALSGGTLSATSDRRLKNIINTASGIDLSTLIPYRYTFKSDKKKDVHIGLIAQEVQRVIPEAVKVTDKKGHLGIEYNALVAILIDKVNQLERRCAQLEANLQGNATF